MSSVEPSPVMWIALVRGRPALDLPSDVNTPPVMVTSPVTYRAFDLSVEPLDSKVPPPGYGQDGCGRATAYGEASSEEGREPFFLSDGQRAGVGDGDASVGGSGIHSTVLQRERAVVGDHGAVGNAGYLVSVEVECDVLVVCNRGTNIEIVIQCDGAFV